MQSPKYGPDPTSPHTTFVQADPSNFRSIVQKLTGASDDPSTPKLPLTLPSRGGAPGGSSSSAAANLSLPVPDRRPPPAFKLHERRHRKLDQIQLTNPNNRTIMAAAVYHHRPSLPSSHHNHIPGGGIGIGMSAVMVSPVSPLDLFAATRMMSVASSPSSSSLLSPSEQEQEDKAIAEKGFYLHPSPRNRNTPRGGTEPELLPLFPLQSPRDPDNPDRRRS